MNYCTRYGRAVNIQGNIKLSCNFCIVDIGLVLRPTSLLRLVGLINLAFNTWAYHFLNWSIKL